MKFIIVAENINHHIEPFVTHLIVKVGIGNLTYFVLNKPEEYRLKMGFSARLYEENYVVCLNDDISKLAIYRNDFLSADVVLFSSRLFFDFAIERCSLNKLTFYFSERWWKPSLGLIRLFNPRHLFFFFKLVKFSKEKHSFYLGQGGSAIKDLSFFGLFKNRSYNFAYFSESGKNNKTNHERCFDLIWSGRILKWKRLDLLILSLAKVKKTIPEIRVVLVGDGPQKNKLLKLINRYNLNENISFFPFLPHDELRLLMRKSKIFVLPSNGYEGWGVVINEAILERAVTISFNECGASSAMIIDGETGLKFHKNDSGVLAEIIINTLRDRKLLHDISNTAFEHIDKHWSSEVAVVRFLKIVTNLLDYGYDSSSYSGIFSKG